jgi:hypothetical protein
MTGFAFSLRSFLEGSARVPRLRQWKPRSVRSRGIGPLDPTPAASRAEDENRRTGNARAPLVPRLRLGTHCGRGSASCSRQCVRGNAGGACGHCVPRQSLGTRGKCIPSSTSTTTRSAGALRAVPWTGRGRARGPGPVARTRWCASTEPSQRQRSGWYDGRKENSSRTVPESGHSPSA